MKSKILGTLIVFVCVSSPVSAQDKPGAIAPAQALKDEKWDEIDQRLVFLMVRLANVETSLDAVEKAIGKSTAKRSSNLSAAKRAEAGNERMDRQGGGPMKWSEFYGRTAEKFFYHPTDRNTTYHTTTVLSQQGPQADNKVGGGVPAGQGLPVHQRPPQFDYIYRANENAKAKAEEEAAELKGKTEALIARRQRLEVEQAGLWCEVAFRAVSHYDLDKKPLYRFEPVVGVDSESRQHADSMKAAASFMALALSIIDEAQKDQAATFSRIKKAVSDNRERLNDSWLRLAIDVTDRKTPEGKFAALAKRLDDVASNLSDSYIVSVEGDQAKDQQRKDTFRALLQESLVGYAQIILALDEMSVVMRDEWKIKPDVNRPIQFVSLSTVEAVRPAEESPVTLREPVEVSPNQKTLKALQGEWLVISEEVNGEVNPQEKVTATNRRIRIKDDALTMTRTSNGKFGVYEGNVEINATSRHFDWSGKGPNQADVQWIGIFELNGDRLKLCYKYVKNGTIRPTAFKTAPPSQFGEGFVNLVLKRIGTVPSDNNERGSLGGVIEPGNVALASNGTKATRIYANAAALLDGLYSGEPAHDGFGKPWLVTFPKTYRLKRIKMKLWDDPTRFYTYRIDASEDGVTFKPLIDRSQGQWTGWQVMDFPAQPIKVIRLTGLSDTKNTGFHVHEFEAYCIP